MTVDDPTRASSAPLLSGRGLTRTYRLPRPSPFQPGAVRHALIDADLDVAVAVHEYGDTAHGWAMGLDDSGYLVKLVGDRATGLLVGAHLVGPQASVLVQPLIQAMSFGQPVAGLARGQYWIHPALTEVVEGALLDLEEQLG